MNWNCPMCKKTIVAPKTEEFKFLVLQHKVDHILVFIDMFDDRISELEKKVNRVPGSAPGDYTWDELVGRFEEDR